MADFVGGFEKQILFLRWIILSLAPRYFNPSSRSFSKLILFFSLQQCILIENGLLLKWTIPQG